MSIQFTDSSNNTRTYTHVQLDTILLDLNANNQYWQSGSYNVAYIRLSLNHLLLIDLDYSNNRKLFENYSFQYSDENEFNLRLINNNTASELTINEALISIGYTGLTLTYLQQIYIYMYTKATSITPVKSSKKTTLNLYEEINTFKK